VENLAKDFKLSACGRQPSLLLFFLLFDLVCAFCSVFMCFSGQVSAIQVGGAFSYVVPDLRHPSGIVFLVTLETM
jgi:hypothetical protein